MRIFSKVLGIVFISFAVLVFLFTLKDPDLLDNSIVILSTVLSVVFFVITKLITRIEYLQYELEDLESRFWDVYNAIYDTSEKSSRFSPRGFL
ncbi:MAG: hypothetical protein CVU97_04065 [Firmicutes bacterium HGW-Firmicutes-21]|nr:MAG: hypothetical protein CVU97_04065 [Firmicutes bacterium HGW-Firmicutes-21]